METERPLLRVPFECYSRDFRLSQKRVEKELKQITEAIANIDPTTGATPDLLQQLATWETQLTQLQAEHAATVKAEAQYGELLAKRLSHLLQGYRNTPNELGEAFTKSRLHRLIIGNLLLNGFVNSARLLAKHEGLTHLVDADVFEELHAVGDALLRHDVQPALKWAATLASRLRRIDSPLVLQLRRFQFLELVRTGRKQQALEHASQHFGGAAATAAEGEESKTSAASNALMQLQQDMALLAFPDPVHCGVPAYERLFEQARWEELRQLLLKEAGRALGFEAGASTLDVVLRAGLIALKLPTCSHTPLNKIDLALPYGPPAKHRIASSACPACNPLLAPVAAGLPACRRTKSFLVCQLSQTPMEGENYPMALKNGSVYGRRALEQMALEHGGKVLCPRTSQTLEFKDARRAYMG